MMKIPICSNLPYFSQEHVLFGHSYIFEFEWIEREAFWVLHLYDGAENPLALGLRVALDGPIFLDKKAGVIFWLFPKAPNASLNLLSFHKDFAVMAEAVDALI